MLMMSSLVSNTPGCNDGIDESGRTDVLVGLDWGTGEAKCENEACSFYSYKRMHLFVITLKTADWATS